MLESRCSESGVEGGYSGEMSGRKLEGSALRESFGSKYGIEVGFLMKYHMVRLLFL